MKASNLIHLICISGALALSAAGCKKDAPAVGAAPAVAAPAGKQPADRALTGTVLESFDSGGYTYLRLGTEGGEKWAAVQQAPVKKDQKVTVANAALMRGFHSKTLDRTFEEIYFGSLRAAGDGKRQVPEGHLGLMHPKPSQQPQMDVGDPPAKAEGPDGRTVAEVHAQKGTLGGKKVAVRGKVVRLNEGILGKNWLHLQDGSGKAADGSHDLTVTTSETAKLGDIVLVTGTVGTDRDFGAGYKYDVILESAAIQKK